MRGAGVEEEGNDWNVKSLFFLTKDFLIHVSFVESWNIRSYVVIAAIAFWCKFRTKAFAEQPP